MSAVLCLPACLCVSTAASRGQALHGNASVQACNLIGKVGLDEIVPESPVELFVALPPVDKGPSKVLTSYLDLPVPLVPRRATSIPVFIEGCVRRASHRLVGERRCSTPAVYVDDFAQSWIAAFVLDTTAAWRGLRNW